METDRVMIFAKPAVPGRVKTRLIPALTPEAAAALQVAFLEDVIEIVRAAVDSEAELVVSGDEDTAEAFRRRYPGHRVTLQRGADLGARLLAAFEESFVGSTRRAIVLGSDHPTLPHGHVATALERLSEVDAVLGPSRDGGYYLVGLSRDGWPRSAALFQDVPWSTPEVLAVSLDRARRSDLMLALLPEWYDVDRPEDLERLWLDARPGSATLACLRGLRGSQA